MQEKIKEWIFRLLDHLLTRLETKLYRENYYEADNERMELKLKVAELQNEINYLKEEKI